MIQISEGINSISYIGLREDFIAMLKLAAEDLDGKDITLATLGIDNTITHYNGEHPYVLYVRLGEPD